MSERGTPGPKGDKGDTGARGLQGLKGDKGDPGSAAPINYTQSSNSTSLTGAITGVNWDTRYKTVTYSTDDGNSLTINYG